MFLTTDVFFFLSSGHRTTMVHTDKNSILWFSFRLHLKSHLQSEDYAPRHNHQFLKHSIFLSVSQLEKSIFLDLVLLRFTPQLLPALSIDLLDFQLLILRQLHYRTVTYQFLNFLPSGIQSGKKSNVGRHCMNHTLKSILTFTLLIFRTKQGTWYKQIQLMKGSDFLIILSSQHFIGNTFRYTALWELHTDESYLSQKEKAIFCLYQSSFQSEFSNCWHNTGFGDNTISPDLRRPVINQLWFPGRHFSLCLGKVHVQINSDERLLQALLSLASRGVVTRSLAHSCVAHLARPNRRACPQATSSLSLS